MNDSRRNGLQRVVLRLARSQAGAWFFARVGHHADRLVLRLTGGRSSLTQLLAGYDLAWLTTRGARTGQPRTLPLVATPDGEAVILIASNWGQAAHPAWYRNLCTHPQVTLSWHGRRGAYQARQLEGPDRQAAWALALANYPGYADYARRTARPIPVIRLTPVRSSTDGTDRAE